MNSMTGYGKGIATDGQTEVVVELRTVNNRFLEINSRLPKSQLACDEIIRSLISKQISRGSVDVFFLVKTENSKNEMSADFERIRQYSLLTQKIKKQTGLKTEISFSNLLSMGLICADTPTENPEKIAELTKTATKSALEALLQMRGVEGESIKADLSRLAGEIENRLSEVEKRSPLVAEEHQKRLRERIAQHLAEVEIDESKLLNEVAFFADKADINEEIQRLSSHLNQFRIELESADTIGRKLDFISQEMGREINTMGSKSNDLEIANLIIDAKNLLEKIKEQIRNVE